MKKIKALIFLLLLGLAMFAQEITGTWNGILKVQGMQLRVNFNIESTGIGYHSTMDSPDQNALGIPVDSTFFENNMITIKIPNMGILYSGNLVGDSIVGTFSQIGQSFPMNLSKKKVEKEKINRPQEPQGKQSYYQEEIKFKNSKANIQLAGTLTMPKREGKFPAVVLISGSGPQNRNEEVFGHKPFLVLADFLTKQGIAVLRYDDRGIGESEGDFKMATSFDFATDVEAAVTYLQNKAEIDVQNIGLIGHSEGGLIAPIVATETSNISFIILLSGPGIRGAELLLLQSELIGKASGIDNNEIEIGKKFNKRIYDLVLQSENIEQFRLDLKPHIKELTKDHPEIQEKTNLSVDDFHKMVFNQIASPWMYNFLRYDPTPVLTKVSCPVLAINGEKDLQVPAEINLKGIEKALKNGGNNKVTTQIFPKLNHMFQHCEKGIPAEYGDIEETISPEVLKYISDWIKIQVFQ